MLSKKLAFVRTQCFVPGCVEFYTTSRSLSGHENKIHISQRTDEVYARKKK